jgi:hypothetical protein
MTRRQPTGGGWRGWSGRVDEPVAQAALRSDSIAVERVAEATRLRGLYP